MKQCAVSWLTKRYSRLLIYSFCYILLSTTVYYARVTMCISQIFEVLKTEFLDVFDVWGCRKMLQVLQAKYNTATDVNNKSTAWQFSCYKPCITSISFTCVCDKCVDKCVDGDHKLSLRQPNVTLSHMRQRSYGEPKQSCSDFGDIWPLSFTSTATAYFLDTKIAFYLEILMQFYSVTFHI